MADPRMDSLRSDACGATATSALLPFPLQLFQLAGTAVGLPGVACSYDSRSSAGMLTRPRRMLMLSRGFEHVHSIDLRYVSNTACILMLLYMLPVDVSK